MVGCKYFYYRFGLAPVCMSARNAFAHAQKQVGGASCCRYYLFSRTRSNPPLQNMYLFSYNNSSFNIVLQPLKGIGILGRFWNLKFLWNFNYRLKLHQIKLMFLLLYCFTRDMWHIHTFNSIPFNLLFRSFVLFYGFEVWLLIFLYIILKAICYRATNFRVNV